MNEDIKKKWVGALRSGKYSQAQGRLRDGEGFCCLGVLCNIMGAEWELTQHGWHIAGQYGSIYYLPKIIANQVGLNERNPRIETKFMDGKYFTTIGGMNDAGFSFDEIANVIEAEL